MAKKEIVNKLFKNIKLLILDVDGVLTKGEIIYDNEDRELKIFNVKDGLGVFLLRKLGIKTIFLSARNSKMLKRRAKDMRVAEVIGGIMPKEKTLGGIKRKYKVSEKEICFIGDDLIDLGMINRVGLGIAVNDAPPIVRKAASYVTAKNGGEGAVREVVDLIIKYQKLEKKIYRILENPR
ncbi:MAG: HAD-IIIA family hydrolase [Candidatus Omnitrophica bacterium]|nr:HAD-IIIA family hydrolase [Candidatus Omnitrophota bacterium]